MSRKRAREPDNSSFCGDDYDDDDDNESYECDDNDIVIPIVPNKNSVSKEHYVNAVEKYIVVISKIAQFASETYVECISSRFEDKSYEQVAREELQLTSVYDEVVNYGFIQSEKEEFTEVFLCKSKKEDVQRKTSLRTHLFWEICKLRWSLNKMRNRMKNTFGDEKAITRRKKREREDYVKALFDLNVCLYPRKNTNTFTQRELDQAFFLLSSCWKTIDYSPVLSKYVNRLIDRMCDFFCFSMSSDEMDDADLRQPLPMEMLPRFQISSRSKESKRRNDRKGGRKGEEEREEEEEEENNDPRQYAPNFDFVIMCQMRFFNFLNDLSLYENRPKKDLKTSLDYYRSECVRIKNVKKNVFSKYDSETYLNVNMIKRFVLDSCQHVSPEQKEKTASRYVFSTFSKTDYEWLVYKQPVDLPSFADEFISKACKDSAYTQVVERTRKTYAEILKEDAGDVKLTGFYEWCVLKNASRLFALHFDIFEKAVVNREEVRENSVFIFNYSKPLIVQFFSRYHVFYDGYLFVDETIDSSSSNVNESTIYDTLMLWICIMLKDFGNSKKSKRIESTLKNKYAEYFKLEEMERNAKDYEFRKQQRSRIQMEDEEISVRNDKEEEEEEEEKENEDEDNDGRSQRQNVHDVYFEKAVNLSEEVLSDLNPSEREKTGLYFF
jgi:hypothetical protein